MPSHWAMLTLVVGGLLLRLGVASYATGASRAKNAASSAARHLMDLCLVTLAFWAVGLAILGQTSNSAFGVAPTLLIGWQSPTDGSLAGYLVLALIGSALVPAAMAERSRFGAGVVASLVAGAILFPLAAFWVWHGWLNHLGFIDRGGAAAVHLVAGVFAAIGAWTVGPRANKYNRDGSSNVILGHSVPLALSGVMVMVLGWCAYLTALETLHVGSAAGPVGVADLVRTPINVLLGGAAAGVAACLYGFLRYGKVDPSLIGIGLLGGLVSVSGAGGGIASAPTVCIGAIAGILVPWATVVLDLRCKLDDPTAAAAIHGVGGLWGTLAAAWIADGDAGNRLGQLGVQAAGAAALIAVAAGLGLIVFGTLRAMKRLRSKEADEFDGLDLAEHDMNAYPDFHQSMIKSYHLREA